MLWIEKKEEKEKKKGRLVKRTLQEVPEKHKQEEEDTTIRKIFSQNEKNETTN